MGHGVPVVMNMQATYLAGLGHEVVIGGPKGRREMPYEGCRRVPLSTPDEAAAFAVEAGMDCVIAETPPFFSIVRWLGDWPRTLLLDHGEPPPDLFPDAAARHGVLAEKRLCFAMATQVCVISEAVKNQGLEETAQIIPNANSHLLIWDESSRAQRDEIRRRRGWQEKLVVLNVCRFHAAERRYKGLDTYMELFHEFRFARPRLAAQTTFLLCGKACSEDVEAMQKAGFDVHANVTDAELVELYLAADIYANFSRWEGYNLGIGQALAAGLPVLASDIAAHRAFSIFTSNEILKLIEKLTDLAQAEIMSRFARKRQPIVTDWSQSLQALEREVLALCRDAGNVDAPAFARV
jgi:glycosyltransferase involved in cell wall biosynthesis